MLDETAPPEADEPAPDTTAEENAPQTATPPPVIVPQDDGNSHFYRFLDEHGVSAAGNLEPLIEIGLTVAIPTMIKNPETGKQEPGETVTTITITPGDSLFAMAVPARIVPGTRTIESADARVDSALMASGKWEQIDKPTKKDSAAEAKALQDAIDEAANRSNEER